MAEPKVLTQEQELSLIRGLMRDLGVNMSGDTTADTMYREARTAIEIRNGSDPEFIKQRESHFAGKILGEATSKFKKQFGLTAGEIKDKDIEQVYEIGFTKLMSQSGDAEATMRNLKAAQEERDAAVRARELAESKVAGELETGKIGLEFERIANAANLVSSPRILAQLAQGELTNKFKVGLENGTLSIKRQDGSKPFNAQGAAMEAKDVVMQFFEEQNLVIKNNTSATSARQNGKEVEIAAGKSNERTMLPNERKAYEHAEQLKARSLGQNK